MTLVEAVLSRSLRKAIRIGFSVVAVSLAGCGSATLPFEPVHPSATVAATYPAAAYELKVGPRALGKAAVWSEGATDVRADGERTLDVEMSIHNASNTPIHLEAARSDVTVTTHDGRTVPLGAPVRVGGSRTVAPVSSSRVGLHYALPAGLVAGDFARFDFNWHVASSAGDYAQSTAFIPLPPPASDVLNDRGLICNGMYRVSSIDECVGDAPATSRPLQ